MLYHDTYHGQTMVAPTHPTSTFVFLRFTISIHHFVFSVKFEISMCATQCHSSQQPFLRTKGKMWSKARFYKWRFLMQKNILQLQWSNICPSIFKKVKGWSHKFEIWHVDQSAHALQNIARIANAVQCHN